MSYSIFGVTIDALTDRLSDHFDEVLNDAYSQMFYQSKRVFKHEEEGLNFNYRYCIEVINMDAWTGDDSGEAMIMLKMVPELDSLCGKMRNSVLESCGLEADDCTSFDVSSYGCNIGFGDCTVDLGDNCMCMDECPELLEKLDTIASVFEPIDSLRGFYLDRAVNRIGTTGWDMLDDFINGKDFLQATLSRHSA